MLTDYSVPSVVYRKAREMFGNDVEIKESTRKDKKYMLKSPAGRWIHFGQMGYEDYSKHKNLMRREAFRLRNKKWKDADTYTPAYLSYWLLW